MGKTGKERSKENLIPWEKGQSGNPKGRARKSFSSINAALQEEGVEPLKKGQLIEAYSLIFNCTEDKLKEISVDPDTPYALKLIILELNDKKKRTAALKDYRDYSFGRAKASAEVTVIKEQPLFGDDN